MDAERNAPVPAESATHFRDCSVHYAPHPCTLRFFGSNDMPDQDTPVVLKLASLPRNQIGPFLILGVDKDATREAIEAAWAQRLIAARKSQTSVPIEDINWAREIVSDPERRLRADAISMSIETSAGTLRQLRDRFQQTSSQCQPIDVEPTFLDYQPNVPAATVEEVRNQVPEPRI